MNIKYLTALILILHFQHSYTQVPTEFTTNRLHAERLTEKHIPYLDKLLNNQQIQETYNTCDIALFTDVAAQFAFIHDQWQNYGYGLYIVFDQNTHECIGCAGYHTITLDDNNSVCDNNNETEDCELELYLFLHPSYWRQGYGHEIMTKLITLAFDYLPYQSVVSYVKANNYPSLQLMKKLGHQEEQNVTYHNYDFILFRLHKGE